MTRPIHPAAVAGPQFTPGPWSAGIEGNNRVYGPDSSGGHSGLVAVTCKGAGNKHLTAAAPDLFAELQQFVNGVETGMIQSPADETLAIITRRARAAIAKALGQ